MTTLASPVGQYGLVKGKAFPFDVDTKVPFLVRGPGIMRSLKSELVANIDIAPTFLHIAGLQVLHFF
jgi:arylsulfatase A-like enzyme